MKLAFTPAHIPVTFLMEKVNTTKDRLIQLLGKPTNEGHWHHDKSDCEWRGQLELIDGSKVLFAIWDQRGSLINRITKAASLWCERPELIPEIINILQYPKDTQCITSSN